MEYLKDNMLKVNVPSTFFNAKLSSMIKNITPKFDSKTFRSDLKLHRKLIGKRLFSSSRNTLRHREPQHKKLKSNNEIHSIINFNMKGRTKFSNRSRLKTIIKFPNTNINNESKINLRKFPIRNNKYFLSSNISVKYNQSVNNSYSKPDKLRLVESYSKYHTKRTKTIEKNPLSRQDSLQKQKKPPLNTKNTKRKKNSHKFAKNNPKLKFLVTEIGCGIAGFKPEEIAPLFKDALNVDNIYLPKKLYKILTEV